jgi:GNAT superfamily N-acetyltransferase
MDYRIRPALPDDAPVLTRHRIRMMEDMGMGTESERQSIRPVSQDYFSRAVADGVYHGWLVEDAEHRVVAGGGVLLVPWPPSPLDGSTQRPYIINMYTEPEHRRQGLARRIVDQLLAFCRERGFATVRLNASEMGRPVYEAAGFAPSNEMRIHLDPQP